MNEIKHISKFLIFVLLLFILGIIGCIVIKNSRVNYDKDIQLFNKTDTIK